jgi:glycosyltransferase involved in cell wall biosynthesis
MRIVCTVTNDLSQDQRMHRICATLQAAGYRVTLVGRQRPGSLPLADRAFAQVRLPCRFERGKLFYLEFQLRLAIFLLRTPFDIVNSVDLDTLLPGWFVARLRGKRLVFDAHEYFQETPEVVRRPGIKWTWSRLAAFLIPRVDRAYTVGPALAQLFATQYGIPFGIVRNFPYRQAHSAQAALPPPTLLYQGMLNEGRGLEIAIKALHHLPEYTLWLVGSGDREIALHQLVREEGLGNQVRFFGFVPPDQLPELTRQARFGLNLLENRGLSYYYSLANKAFDYVQSGLPSVQMDFPEYRALQAEYPAFLLLDELAPEHLAAAIRSAEDADTYSALQSNCRRAAEDWCWEREVSALLEQYEHLLS